MNPYIYVRHTGIVYKFLAETYEYMIREEDVLRDPSLVPSEIFRDLIIGIIPMDDNAEDIDANEFVKYKHPGWMLGVGRIGLRSGAPKEVIENWNNYIEYHKKTHEWTEEET